MIDWLFFDCQNWILFVCHNWTEFTCQLQVVDVLIEIGCFDEKFVFGTEDDDLCIRIKENGNELAEIMNSVALHSLSGSTNFKDLKSTRFLVTGFSAGSPVQKGRNRAALLFFELTRDLFFTFTKVFIENRKFHVVLITDLFKDTMYGLTYGNFPIDY